MKVNTLTPNLAVPETQDGAERQLTDGKEYVYAMLKKDGIELMLQRVDSFH